MKVSDPIIIANQGESGPGPGVNDIRPDGLHPVNQGFPKAPDGGVIVPTAIDYYPAGQAFAPAPLVQPFPAPPNEAPEPVLPAAVGMPMAAVDYTLTPGVTFNPRGVLNVDVAKQTFTPMNVRQIVVSDQGSYDIDQANAVVEFIVAGVVDTDTGLPATYASVNVVVTLTPTTPGALPLTTYGIQFNGRVAIFTVSVGYANRVISANDAVSITVPNAGFIPVAGDTVVIPGTVYNAANPAVVGIVVDAATLLPPTLASANLKVSFEPATTFAPGALVGTTAAFTSAVLQAQRPISFYTGLSVVIPVQGADKSVFVPMVGDRMNVNTARYDGVISQFAGLPQNVVPGTQQLPVGFLPSAGNFPVYLPVLGEETSLLPVPEYVVNEQAPPQGTPDQVEQGISLSNQSSVVQNVLVGTATNIFGTPINVYPGAQNR